MRAAHARARADRHPHGDAGARRHVVGARDPPLRSERVDKETARPGAHQGLLRRHRRRRAARARAHQARAARRRLLRRHVVHAAGAVDAGDAHARPVPEPRRAHLRPRPPHADIDAEFRKRGFINLGEATSGRSCLFTREPVRTLAELRKTLLWTWDVDETLEPRRSTRLGLHIVAAPLERGARALRRRQASTASSPCRRRRWRSSGRRRRKYLLPLGSASLTRCVFFANRAFDPLPDQSKRDHAQRGGEFAATHCDELGKEQDDALARRAVRQAGADDAAADAGALRARLLLRGARAARQAWRSRWCRRRCSIEVLSLLADYRAEHRDVEGP